MSVEQLGVKVLLELLELMGHGRLADMQSLSAQTNASLLENSMKNGEVV
jgi:hypothetical protein